MNRFNCETTTIEGVFILTPKQIQDSRGYYERFFCANEFQEIGLKQINQVNHSSTLKQGTVRGFHFQHPPFAEIKVVRCVKGAVLDVALDLRANSKTFLQTVAIELTEENNKYLVLPKGIAHGFQTLKDNSDIIYCTDTPYTPEADDGVNPKDSLINFVWPLEITSLSDNDKNRKLLNKDFSGLIIE